MNKLSNVILAVLIAIPFYVMSQNYKYSYDAAGNRIKKEIILSQQDASSKYVSKSNLFSDKLCDKTVYIHPNPTSGVLKVEITGYDNSDSGALHVFNLAGQHLFNLNITSAFTQLDISEQPKGIYILQLELNGESSIWKIIKE